MGAVDEKARARLDAVEQWLGDAAWQDNARVAALERRVAALEAEAGAALGKQEVASGANPPAPVSATLDTKACVICGAPVSIAPGQHHWCLYPFEGPAHKGCARARGFTDDFSEVKDAYGFTKRVPGKRARAALAVAPDATEPEEK